MDSGLIAGVICTELRQIESAGGPVLHCARADDTRIGSLGECYFSEVLPGAVKAWKRHRLQTQNFAVPVGRIRIVLYDDRDGSPSHGQILVLELGRPDAYCRLRVPPGLWYGFAGLSTTPALVANCTDLPHDPSESENRLACDAAIPYEWGRVP
jgi:dTDP-4-dehydrorhamnose 3,5-epimerase